MTVTKLVNELLIMVSGQQQPHDSMKQNQTPNQQKLLPEELGAGTR